MTPKKEVLCVSPRDITRAIRALVEGGLKASLAPSPTARAILLTSMPESRW